MSRHPPGYWTKERCSNEAFWYDTRKAFELGCNQAYRAAKKKGWLDEVCTHMQRQIKPPNHWTKDRCAEEALKCVSRYEFQSSCQGAYSAAKKHGWLDEICRHMRTPSSDVVYMIREEMPEGEFYLVKFGMTSSERGKARIREGFDHFQSPVVVATEVMPNARECELYLLKRYVRKPNLHGRRSLGGITELRLLTDDEVLEASKIITL